MAALAGTQLLLGYHLSAPPPLSYYSAAVCSAASPACCALAWHGLHPDTTPTPSPSNSGAKGFRRRCLGVSPPPVDPSPPLIPRPRAAPFPAGLLRSQSRLFSFILGPAISRQTPPLACRPSPTVTHSPFFLNPSLAFTSPSSCRISGDLGSLGRWRRWQRERSDSLQTF